MVVSSRLNVSDPRLAWSMRPARALSLDRTRDVVEKADCGISTTNAETTKAWMLI
jgi:hypothetical protein